MRQKLIKFGENLKILRGKNNLTQQDLSDKLHVTRQTISKWEYNQGLPSIDILSSLQLIFNVSYEVLLHGHVSNTREIVNSDLLKLMTLYDEKPMSYIRKIDTSGFYDIISDDLATFFPAISFTFSKIMVITLELNKLGYMICSVYSNGFSLYLPTDESSSDFKRDLYEIIDAFIHNDGSESSKQNYTNFQDRIYTTQYTIMNEVHSEIFGQNTTHYWVDENDCIRGFGNSEDTCKGQAKTQNCTNYKILRNE